jgi:RNA polymerase sigma-70 factor (ECF subfamily)
LLSDGEQELFQLHFQKGMTHSEISEKAGVQLGTVKTQLRRGLIKLRQKLQEFQ